MAVIKRKTRKELRDTRAGDVCREVRYQMVKYGHIAETKKLFDLMYHWMKVTGKEKYERPK